MPDHSRSRTFGGVAQVDQAEIRPELFERWALVYLGRYASSSENLRRVLLRRALRRAPVSPEAAQRAAVLIDALVERYRHSGLLDDTAYAAAHAVSLHRRGESTTRIRARLAAKGVENSVAVEAVQTLCAEDVDPDVAAACAFARRRRLGPYRRTGADPARELGVFARAGFTRRVAERVLACADIDAVEVLARADPH
jgi:regulatory protein